MIDRPEPGDGQRRVAAEAPAGISAEPWRNRPMRPLALASLWLLALSLLSSYAHAIPTFNRQTEQNCAACHAGGQFPELTPCGRIFKLTGYTIGQRALPISVMAVASVSNVVNIA